MKSMKISNKKCYLELIPSTPIHIICAKIVNISFQHSTAKAKMEKKKFNINSNKSLYRSFPFLLINLLYMCQRYRTYFRLQFNISSHFVHCIPFRFNSKCWGINLFYIAIASAVIQRDWTRKCRRSVCFTKKKISDR